ncbi:MAG: DUF2490 domain-containing protein [Tannerellaceae bacterium]|jgi:hypothetical protein|nr:DUF2490 domain-containing protein [Tannerellaceae bacterium]
MLGRLAGCGILLLFFSCGLRSQQARGTEGGMLLSLVTERDLYRSLSLSLEEELRLISGGPLPERASGSLGIDYAVGRRHVKIGLYYAFIYLYGEEHVYESRHRFFLNLSYRHSLGPLTFSWRIRLQETLRNESRGSYRINPRYGMKNKLEAEYSPWGKPWKPFLSCDVSTNLNDPETRYDAVRLRFQGGIVRRLNRTTSIDLFVRWDEYLKDLDPRVISIGVTCKN